MPTVKGEQAHSGDVLEPRLMELLQQVEAGLGAAVRKGLVSEAKLYCASAPCFHMSTMGNSCKVEL